MFRRWIAARRKVALPRRPTTGELWRWCVMCTLVSAVGEFYQEFVLFLWDFNDGRCEKRKKNIYIYIHGLCFWSPRNHHLFLFSAFDESNVHHIGQGCRPQVHCTAQLSDSSNLGRCWVVLMPFIRILGIYTDNLQYFLVRSSWV